MKHNSAEKGQTLVLIILAIVGMFGFAALALDGGRLYSERRRSQSAADATALSVAFAASQGTDFSEAQVAGLNLAATNGFNNDGASNTVSIIWPPESGPYQDNEEYYQVKIWQRVPPIFAQMIFSGDGGVTTEAVAHARPISSVSSGQAVHSLDPGEDSMIWNGGVNVRVKGGNIYANGSMTKNGTNPHELIEVQGGGNFIVGDITLHGDPILDPPAAPAEKPMDAQTIPTPYCPDHDEVYNGVHYYYHSGLSTSATLQPGFHCFYGPITLHGGDVVKGNNVVIVMMQGGITMNGNSVMQIKRPNDIVDKNGFHWGGLLIYAPPTNESTFELGGTNDSTFTGTVLIPRGTCDIGGTPSATGLHMALICWRVRNHGTSDLNIIYQEDENFRVSSMVELVQ